MDAHDLISFRRYGFRMIGAVSASERAAMARQRYMGAGPLLNLGPGNLAPTGGALVGESYVPAPAKPVLSLHFGGRTLTPPAPPPPSHVIVMHLGTSPALPPALVVTAPPPPVSSDGGSFNAPAPADCPPCSPWTTPKKELLSVGVAGGLAGGLLMYFVGLATREKKKRRKNPRRRRNCP